LPPIEKESDAANRDKPARQDINQVMLVQYQGGKGYQNSPHPKACGSDQGCVAIDRGNGGNR